MIFFVIPDMREKKGEGEEEEITLQQINITVEKVRKKAKEHDKKEIEKVKRKEKSKVVKTQEPTGKTGKTYLTYQFNLSNFSYVKSSTTTSRLYINSRFCSVPQRGRLKAMVKTYSKTVAFYRLDVKSCTSLSKDNVFVLLLCVLEKDTKKKPDKKVKVTKVDEEPHLKKKKSGT